MGELNIQSSYTWTPGSDKMIRVSKSTLDTYSNWCGQQLWLSKVCPVEEQEHDYLIIGDNVHKRHEQYYINGGKDEYGINVIKNAMKAAKNGDDEEAFTYLHFLYPEADGDYAEREQEQQDWLIRQDVLRLKYCDTPEDFLPVGNELDLDAIVDVDVPGHGMVKVHLRGIIDRIFKTDDGVALMELKTGKWRPQYDVPKIKGEMAYYAYLLNESDADLGPVTHWGWRYPGADHWDFQEAKKVSITAAKKRLGRLVKSYLEEDFPVVSYRQQYKCGHCDYMAFCHQWTQYENPIEVANGAEPIWKEGES